MFRKQFGMMLLTASVLALAGCGSSRPQLTGDWTANLLECSGCSPTWSFNLTLAQGSGSILNLANYHNHFVLSPGSTIMFTQYPSCIGPIDTDLEHTILGSGTLNVTSGAFQMAFNSPPAVGTVYVSLQGTLKNNAVTGTWTASGNGGLGFGCSVAASGNFTMTKL